MKEEKTISKDELEKIGKFTRKDVTQDEIYTFSLILCDNEIDREGDKFTVDSLKKLAELFIGKTGIFDHDVSSKGQTARIYDTEIVTDETRITEDGEPYTFVRAKAYMPRTEKNKSLIEEIETGIKKETSVGCAIGHAKCSICGKDLIGGICEHIRGAIYDGKKCCRLLCDPKDAYEWSFVAVPAQKNAGIVKSYGKKTQDAFTASMYREELTKSIVSRSYTVIPEIGTDLIEKICNCLPFDLLRALRDGMELRNASMLPLVSQLAPLNRDCENADDNKAYII